MSFTQTASQSLMMTGTSTSILINQASAPTVAYLSAGIMSALEATAGATGESTDQTNSIFFVVGSSPQTVDASNGSLLRPGANVQIALTGAPLYVSAIGASGNGLGILLGVQ